MNKEKIAILILLALLIWFGSAIVRLENYHYAVQVGFCREFDKTVERYTEMEECLNRTQTRTSPLWHLLYGLKMID